MNHDDWKANNPERERYDAINDLCVDTEKTIDRIIEQAAAKVAGQRIGKAEFQPCLVDAIDGTDVLPIEQVQLGVELQLRLAIPIGGRGEFAAGNIAEMLDSLADEIRRASK